MRLRDRALVSASHIVAALLVVTVMSFTWRPISIQFISRIAHVVKFSKAHFGYVHAIFSQTSGSVRNAVIVGDPSPKEHVLLTISNILELGERNVCLLGESFHCSAKQP